MSGTLEFDQNIRPSQTAALVGLVKSVIVWFGVRPEVDPSHQHPLNTVPL